MDFYHNCENCGNEEPGTKLYSCRQHHKYCYACAEIIVFDMLRVICPTCKEDHQAIIGIISNEDKTEEDDDDDLIDDLIDDDIHDYQDDI